MIRRIVGIYFSPAGVTRRMTERLISELSAMLDESCPDDIETACYDLLEDDADIFLDDETIAVIGLPVYVGKVPLPALRAMRRIHADGATALTAVSYGARTYGNALYELWHHSEELGFKVVGAGAFSLVYPAHGLLRRMHAADGDIESLMDFCRAAAAKISRLAGSDIEGLRIKPAPLEVAGRLPIHRISRISPRAAAAAQIVLDKICIRHNNSEWYL